PYVVEGALEHKDSLGTGSVIRPGEVQRMTAGTGVTHSEYNPSRTEPVHFLQIWILPERQGLAPGYEQRTFPAAEMQGRLRVVASRDGRESSVTLHQDARILAARLAPGEEIVHSFAPGRHAWVQVVRGALALDGMVREGGRALPAEVLARQQRELRPHEHVVLAIRVVHGVQCPREPAAPALHHDDAELRMPLEHARAAEEGDRLHRPGHGDDVVD